MPGELKPSQIPATSPPGGTAGGDLGGNYPNPTVKQASDNFVMPKAAGKGIQGDLASPSFLWRDLEGPIFARTTGAGRPTLNVFRGGEVEEYSFAAGDKVNVKYHMPHDWVPGTDLFIHSHWSHNGTAINGSLVIEWHITYAKGNYVGVFPVERVITQTIPVTDIASHPRWGHFIDEIQLSAAAPAGGQLDTADLIVDGVIKVAMKVITVPTITGGSVAEVFVATADCHYQSSNLGTKQRAPNFYV